MREPRDRRDAIHALVDTAVRRFAPAGLFAKHFARGKLRYDPLYLTLLRRGVIPDGVRLLDLGCGQGVFFALLLAAREQSRAGRWPAGWPPPPSRFRLRGIEVRPAAVRRARVALGSDAELEQLDLRVARVVPSDLIALLDVVHYLEPEAQDRLLRQIADALAPGGLLLMRVGDVTARFAARLTWAVDHLVTLARGAFVPQFHGRTVPQWLAELDRLGLQASAEPMSEGTPFANVLFVARKAG